MSSPTNTAGFVPLGKGIYIKKPTPQKYPTSDSESPSIILIFGWMSAAMPHLMKYTAAYEDLYPSATQILVRSEATYFFSFESTVRANMTPVIETLKAMGCVEPEESGQTIKTKGKPLRILTHCFSNGGACNLSTLHRAITSRHLVTHREVISAIVLDSLPGRGRYEDAKQAFAPVFKNPIFHFCVSVLLVVIYAIAWLRGHLVDGIPLFMVNMTEDLNSSNLLGWMGKKTPRLYLYSDKDELIAPEAVQEHAWKAAAKGFGVKLERFAESKHVSHARMYPERYWREIKAVWERAVAIA